MKNSKMQKGLRPYNVTMKDLKQVVDVVSILFKLLKCSQVTIKHLECKKIKVGENLIGHRFMMVDWKCQTL